MSKFYPTVASLLISFIACVLASKSLYASDIDQAQQLIPFKAEYIAFRFGDDVGTATLALEHLGYDQYSLTYSSKVSKFFLSDKRYEHSIFSFSDGQITPQSYNYTRSGTGPDKALSANFDAASKSIMVDGQKLKDWQGEFDNQLFRIDIPRQLSRDKKEMRYAFVNYRGQPREYIIKVVGKEQLDLPYGMVDSVKIKIDRGSSSRETFAWFSPALDYTLVRLQQFKDGEEQGDIQLKTLVQSPH
ncbi:DUF3108 domain-containing protein [Alteromonas flava]|uniref:DUF3108 domain-containing protein n=1 Tax=Alteromonas flava TaxID=2048003 RepID=UPI000C282860|nr:DUF3108 domain-containing protein [Alteromonas flava]